MSVFSPTWKNENILSNKLLYDFFVGENTNKGKTLYSTTKSQSVFALPSIQAETPLDSVIANALQARSAKTLGNEKIFCAENSPKLIAVQKSKPIMKPYLKPEPKALAPDHFIIVVIKKPNANDETSNAQIISWSGDRLS